MKKRYAYTCNSCNGSVYSDTEIDDPSEAYCVPCHELIRAVAANNGDNALTSLRTIKPYILGEISLASEQYPAGSPQRQVYVDEVRRCVVSIDSHIRALEFWVMRVRKAAELK